MFGQQVTFDQSSAARIELWKDAVEKWSKKPILGYGVLGGPGIVDSQYARVLVEVGLLGSIAFAWIIAMIYKIAWGAFKSTSSNKLFQGLSLGLMAGLSGLLIQAITAGTFIIVRIMEPFWFLTAIVVVIPRAISSSEEERTE